MTFAKCCNPTNLNASIPHQIFNKSAPARRGRKRRSDEAEAVKKVRAPRPEGDKKMKRKTREAGKKDGAPARKGRARHSQNGSEDEDSEEKCAAQTCLLPSGKVDWIQCDGGCEQWFHMACVGLSAEEINEDEDYICNSCSQNSSAFRSLQGSPENPANSPPSPDSTQPSAKDAVL